MGLSGAAIGTCRPQYRPLSAIRYLDANPLPTRYTLFITLAENLGYVQQAVVLAEDNKYPIAEEMSGVLVWRWRLIVEMLMDETSAT
jgi:hypothetical protein